MSDRPNIITRRDVLAGAAVISLGAMLKGCVQNKSVGGITGDAAGAESAGNPDCILTPSGEEGPFYVNVNLVRSDIVEGQSGTPLALTLKVVRAGTCAPIADAVVDIWHASAAGKYSDEASEGTSGQTFLRGVQTTDANGEARFTTIYPGWYPGRTVHVHGKIHINGNVFTTQFFFPDATTDGVFTANAVYNTRGTRGTLNTNDHVVDNEDDGVGAFLRITDNGNGTFSGALTIGIA